MGGGDLNLKKSWHPQTMKNIERVWKAEQKHEAERKKIEELQKELKDERAREEMTRFAQESGAIKKKDDRLDWMYQGPAGQVSRDEYLLGRPIDKQITEQYEEPESGPSAQTGLLPGSIFNPVTPANTLDLAAKIREDPLFQIRKREQDKKREVLTNPVKMRKIKEMLRQNLEKKDKKKKRKKDKKEKKGDKERRKEKKHKRRSLSSSSEEEEEEERSKHRSDSRDEAGRRWRSHDAPGYGLQFSTGRHHHQAAPDHHPSRRQRSRSPSRSPPRNHRDRNSHGSSHRGDRRAEPRAASPQKPRPHKQAPPPSRKLSPEELERRRNQMMDQARQREEDRENNVRRYKNQEEQEKQLEQNRNQNLEQHKGFIHNMKLESAASSSLEDRVKRNIHSIQRTAASLDNFMKR
ncbi:pre-mRNA-splicing factor CWC25 homolog [Cololabis saira]|uniref:pre-mRNA-splicing factor CWC25 homolog n=1 Tax=Cololabis saira TaxID=129043 RepID=UPI002AD54ECD|nr:pre-mRNA-splicing factor CWC25 homolog [Cololabis saira]